MTDETKCETCKTPIRKIGGRWEHTIPAMGDWSVTAHHNPVPAPPLTDVQEAPDESKGFCTKCGGPSNGWWIHDANNPLGHPFYGAAAVRGEAEARIVDAAEARRLLLHEAAADVDPYIEELVDAYAAAVRGEAEALHIGIADQRDALLRRGQIHTARIAALEVAVRSAQHSLVFLRADIKPADVPALLAALYEAGVSHDECCNEHGRALLAAPDAPAKDGE